MRTIEDERDNRNPPSVKRVDRQQGMIDPSQPGAPHHNGWKLESTHHVHHIGVGRNGNPDTADAFHHDRLISVRE